MTIDQIYQIFGGKAEALKALGVHGKPLDRSAPNNWTDPVSQAMADRVHGAAIRTGRMRQYKKVMGK